MFLPLQSSKTSEWNFIDPFVLHIKKEGRAGGLIIKGGESIAIVGYQNPQNMAFYCFDSHNQISNQPPYKSGAKLTKVYGNL